MDSACLVLFIFSFLIEIFCWNSDSKSKNEPCLTNTYFVNGSCKECPAGFYGLNCEERCPRSFFGAMCLQKCSDCEWTNCDSVVGCREDLETICRAWRANTSNRIRRNYHSTASRQKEYHSLEETSYGTQREHQRSTNGSTGEIISRTYLTSYSSGTSVIHSDVPTIEDDTPNTASTIIVQHVHQYPIVAIPGNITALQGENVYISCDVESEAKIKNVTWSFEIDVFLQNQRSTNLPLWNTSKYLGGSETNPSLFIKDITPLNDGIYTCTVMNDFGEGNASVRLKVLPTLSESLGKDIRECEFLLKMALLGAASLLVLLLASLSKIICSRKHVRKRRTGSRKFTRTSPTLSNFYASIDDELISGSSHSVEGACQVHNLDDQDRNEIPLAVSRMDETDVKRVADQVYEKLIKSDVGKMYGYSELEAIIEKEFKSVKEWKVDESNT